MDALINVVLPVFGIPVMYLVGKVISVGLERLADRACARK